MDQTSVYKIELPSPMDLKDLNGISPFHLSLCEQKVSSIVCSVQTDQSGLLGVLRLLHGRGIVVLEIKREDISDHPIPQSLTSGRGK